MSQFNIDALRRSDGTYRDASPRIISGALRCGHTAHLQTGLGTIAIRPFVLKPEDLEGERGEKRKQLWPMDRAGQNWLVEYYPAEHDALRPAEYRGNNFDAAVEFIYRHLNGRDHAFEAGKLITWYANQASRDATVLAVLGDDVLIEYEMPGTTSGRETSALVLCHAYAASNLTQLRTYSHRKLPRYWVDAMIDQGTTDWIGMGQRELEPVPFPTGETA